MNREHLVPLLQTLSSYNHYSHISSCMLLLDFSFVSFPLNFVNLFINLLVKTMSGIQLLGNNTSIILTSSLYYIYF